MWLSSNETTSNVVSVENIGSWNSYHHPEVTKSPLPLGINGGFHGEHGLIPLPGNNNNKKSARALSKKAN